MPVALIVRLSIRERYAPHNAPLVVLRGRRINALNATVLAESALNRQILKCQPLEETKMAWKTPTIVEIALGAEINCYACAEL